MDILGGLQIQIDAFWYNLLLNAASLHWSLLRAFILMGYTIELINQWLIENAFIPLISQTNTSLSLAMNLAFVIALLILGITYLFASFIRLEVVQLRSAFQWYLAGALFFSAGPSLFQTMNEFRVGAAQAFYASSLLGLQNTLGGNFDSLEAVTSPELSLRPVCDYLGVYGGGSGVDGLDVALAYLRADGPDVMGYPYPTHPLGCPAHLLNPLTGAEISLVPQEWFFEESYFYWRHSPYYFDELSSEERLATLDKASSVQGRMLTAWSLVLFGVAEKMLNLLITVAQGITFISFGVAVLFAFFKKTESIARSIIDQWLELIVLTIVMALVQALVAAFFLMGTATGSSAVVLGVGLISLVFMLLSLFSGLKAVWNSFNRLFSAFGQATGGSVMGLGQAIGTTASLAAGGAGAFYGTQANALAGIGAFKAGATLPQALGLALGGSRNLSSAARTLAYLPGLRGTSLGDAAEQFTEGAVTRQIAANLPIVGSMAGPMLGAMLLSDRNPENAETDEQGHVINRPMLVPAIGKSLERLAPPSRVQGDYVEDENGEMLPVDSPRMGRFTPIAPQRNDEQTIAENARQGEEMEEHLSGLMGQPKQDNSLQVAATQLEASAMRLQLLAGQLQVSGAKNVATVMGDVLRLPNTKPLDNFGVSQRMSEAMGIQAIDTNKPIIQENLPQFGMFIQQANHLGLSPEQAENIVLEVKQSPSGQLQAETQSSLIEQLQAQGMNYGEAEHEVLWLEHTARNLPNDISDFGMMPIPQIEVSPDVTIEPEITVQVEASQADSYSDAMQQESSLGGSGAILGGNTHA